MSYLYYNGFGTIRYITRIIRVLQEVFVECNMMRIEQQSSSFVQLCYYLLRAWIKGAVQPSVLKVQLISKASLFKWQSRC